MNESKNHACLHFKNEYVRWLDHVKRNLRNEKLQTQESCLSISHCQFSF